MIIVTGTLLESADISMGGSSSSDAESIALLKLKIMHLEISFLVLPYQLAIILKQ